MRIKTFASFFITLLFTGTVLFADTETLVIDAIIPGQNIEPGNESHALFVQDLFLQSQNLIVDNEEVDIGHGSALFTDKPVPLFVVSHVTNSTRPVNISVQVSPFTYTADDGTVTVLSTNVQSQAGLDAYIGDIESFFVTEVNPNGYSQYGHGLDEPNSKPAFSGARLQILNNSTEVLVSNVQSQTVSRAETAILNAVESVKEDEYVFQFQTANEIAGSWNFHHDGWGFGYWVWTTSSVKYGTTIKMIPNDGFITEYVEYSVNITDENIPVDGRYVMNVTVSLTTEE